MTSSGSLVIRYEGHPELLVPYSTGSSLNDLLLRAATEFSLHGTPFHLTDYQQPVLSLEGLSPGSVLHVAMGQPGQLSLPGKEIVSFQPHPKTLTMAGDYEYFAAQGRHPFVYALAEFIDNSLRATSRAGGDREILVSFLLSSAAVSSSSGVVCVQDQGCGMSKKELNDWAVMNYSVEERGQTTAADDAEAGNQGTFMKYLNSSISYFGVGSKNAAFFVGSSVKVVTKRASEPYVHELQLCAGDLEKRYRAGAPVYEATMAHRRPGDESTMETWEARFPATQAWVQAEREAGAAASFTRVLISGVKPDVLAQMAKEAEGGRICRELAHLYHYYLHGEAGNVVDNADRPADQPDIRFEARVANRVLWQRRLSEVDDDMETRTLRSQQSSFPFSYHVPDKGTVWGILYYFPYQNGAETVPRDPEAAVTGRSSLDAVQGAQALATQRSGASQAAGSAHAGGDPVIPAADSEDEAPALGPQDPVFDVFWQGRRIPGARLDGVPFLDALRQRRSAAARDALPDAVFGRLRGRLFLSARFLVTRNKLLLRDDLAALLGRAVPGDRAVLRRARDWLAGCHASLDRVVRFEGPGDARLQAAVRAALGTELVTAFERARVGDRALAVGDAVRLDTRPAHLGRVALFSVPLAGAGEGTHAGGRVHVHLLPAAVYGRGAPRAFSLRRLAWGAPVALEQVAEHERRELERVPASLRLEPLRLAATRALCCAAGDALPETQVVVLSGAGQRLSRAVLDGSRQALAVTQTLWRCVGGDSRVGTDALDASEAAPEVDHGGVATSRSRRRQTKKSRREAATVEEDAAGDENADPQRAPEARELVFEAENRSPVKDVFYFVRLANGLARAGRYILRYAAHPVPEGCESSLALEVHINVSPGPAELVQLGGEGAAIAKLRPLALGEPLGPLTVSFLDAHGNPAKVPELLQKGAVPELRAWTGAGHAESALRVLGAKTRLASPTTLVLEDLVLVPSDKSLTGLQAASTGTDGSSSQGSVVAAQASPAASCSPGGLTARLEIAVPSEQASPCSLTGALDLRIRAGAPVRLSLERPPVDKTASQDPVVLGHPIEVRAGDAVPELRFVALDGWGHPAEPLPGQKMQLQASGFFLHAKSTCFSLETLVLAADNTGGKLAVADLWTSPCSTPAEQVLEVRLALEGDGEPGARAAVLCGLAAMGTGSEVAGSQNTVATDSDAPAFPRLSVPITVLPSVRPVALGLDVGPGDDGVRVRPALRSPAPAGGPRALTELVLPEGLVAGSVLPGLRLVLLDGGGAPAQDRTAGRATVSWHRGSKRVTWAGQGLRLPALQAPDAVPPAGAAHEEWVRFSGDDGAVLLESTIKIAILPALPRAWALRWVGEAADGASQAEAAPDDAPAPSGEAAVARCGRAFLLEAEVLDKFNNRCCLAGETALGPPVLETEGAGDEAMELDASDWQMSDPQGEDGRSQATQNTSGSTYQKRVQLRGRLGQVRLSIRSPDGYSGPELSEDSLVLELVAGPPTRLAFAMPGPLRCGLAATIPSLSVIVTDVGGNPVAWPAGGARGRGGRDPGGDTEISLAGSALRSDGSGAAAAITVAGGNKARPRTSDGAVTFREVRVRADVAGAYTLRAICASRRVALEDAVLCVEAAPRNAVVSLGLTIVGESGDNPGEHRAGASPAPVARVDVETEDGEGVPRSALLSGLMLRVLAPDTASARDATRLRLAEDDAEGDPERLVRSARFQLPADALAVAGTVKFVAEYAERRAALAATAAAHGTDPDEEEEPDGAAPATAKEGRRRGGNRAGGRAVPVAAPVAAIRSPTARLEVVPDAPASLEAEAESMPDALTAGNGEAESPLLVSVALQLVDRFGNAVARPGVPVRAVLRRQRESGCFDDAAAVQAASESADEPDTLPVLVSTLGALGTCEVHSDDEGRALLGDLLIQPGSGGRCCQGSPNGTARLVLAAQVLLDGGWVTPWSLPLLFTDQASRALALAELNSKREQALARREEIAGALEAARQDVEAAEAAVEEAREKLDSAETALPHGTSAPVSLEAGRRALDRALQACKEESREQYASQQAGAQAPRQARYGPAKSPTTASIKELLASGDPGLVCVVAESATIEHPALARIASAQFRSLLDVVVVEDWPARQRLVGILEAARRPVPDILARSHAVPYRGPTEGVIPGFDEGATDLARALLESACADGADGPLPISLPHAKALARQARDRGGDEARAWPEGCLGYLFNLVRPRDPGARAGLLHGLLGPTLVFETLESAAAYREYVVRRLRAGLSDIVTLDGRRITGRGIVSGSGFQVPALERADWRFGSRGGPPPAAAPRAARAAAALRDWCRARAGVEEALRAVEEAVAKLRSLEQEHEAEREVLEAELEALGTQLGGLSPPRPGKHALDGARATQGGRRSKRRRQHF